MTEVISVGIDVGKSKLDVACMRADRTYAHEQFNNSAKGVAQIKRFLKRQRTAPAVPVTLESTGSYHYLVSLSLVDAGYRVNCVNPIITKKYSKVTIRGAKSDKIDSMRIAEIGFLEPNLQEFKTTREHIAAKTRVSSLEHVEKLRQKLAAHVAYLKELKTTIGVTVACRDLEKAIDALEKHITSYREQLCDVAPPEAGELARHVPGLSLQQASVLLVSLADKHFERRDQLVAFVGLDCRLRQSGSWQGKQRISKRGDSYLRKLLYQIGWSLWMNNELYGELYAKKKAEGKHHQTCILVLERRFLRFLYSYYWSKTVTLSVMKTQRMRKYRKSTVCMEATPVFVAPSLSTA